MKMNTEEEKLIAEFRELHPIITRFNPNEPIYGYENELNLQQLEAFLLTAYRKGYEEGRKEQAEKDWMECEDCGKRKESVSYRPNAYANDVHNAPDAMHTVCDECDHENKMDI